jgi:maltose alpha-D-glucosyltransferase/alpha-amylase
VGKQFLIADFEGQANRDLVGRRVKHASLLDVATMIRSLRYVAAHVLLRLAQTGFSNPEELAESLEFWFLWSGATLLKGYLAGVEGTDLLPTSAAQRQALLQFQLLARTLQELIYDLNHRPEWAIVPLNGLLELLEAP